jgi:hypothetical protein
MCIERMRSTDVVGTAEAGGSRLVVQRAVVSFTHPIDLDIEHAVCIDLRADGGDPSERVSVELDEASARKLAETILSALS